MEKRRQVKKLHKDSGTIHNLVPNHQCSYLEEVIIKKGYNLGYLLPVLHKYSEISQGSWYHDSVGKVFLCKYEDQSLDFHETHKQLDIPTIFFSYSAWGQRQINPCDFLASQLVKMELSMFKKRPASKSKTLRRTSTSV